MRQSGHVFWLFGLSGSGKSTIAGRFEEAMLAEDRCCLKLDGDALRAGLNKDLKFSDLDRRENLRRAAEVARLGKDSGLCVISSFITPQEYQRTLIREIIGTSHVSLVYLNATVDVCTLRDPKGLYAEARAGRIRDMTGVTSPFDAPGFPDLILNSAVETESESCHRLVAFAHSRFKLKKMGADAD